MIRVIGLGQRLAGDDAVGLFVTEKLREHAKPGELELVSIHDATALIEALTGVERAIVVDAVVGTGSPGTLHVVGIEAIANKKLAAVSTHGLDVGQALSMAEALYPESVAKEIRIVGIEIEIEKAERYREGLSPEVEAAIEPAARAVLALIQDN